MLRNRNRLIVFRSATPAAPNLPLTVRSAGRNEAPRGWEEPPRQKGFLELFWGLEGRGEFRVDDGWTSLEPGRIFIYRPGDTHHLRAVSDFWRYCWVTFDHADCVRWFDAFGLGGRLHQAGPCPETVFLEITAALREYTAEGERRAAHLAHALLLAASAKTSPSAPDSLPARARALMDRLFTDPAVGVTELAERLRVHRSTLFRRFAASHGLKPSTYLHNLRVQHGLALLRETGAPIHEVALASGFADANYFSRAIREATGLSPREFRNS
ncbi:AraC family transcriptional regulator [Opitutaceae bacterium TAV5]|nr:AraC family transcriptional regulator [Opitutaceae bacterium TAV5]